MRRKPIRVLVSFLLGCFVGLMLHYALYRMGMPIEPFIYMAF
jgi:hypothetical protein